VKEFRKLVNLGRRYGQKFSVMLSDSRRICLCAGESRYSSRFTQMTSLSVHESDIFDAQVSLSVSLSLLPIDSSRHVHG